MKINRVSPVVPIQNNENRNTGNTSHKHENPKETSFSTILEHALEENAAPTKSNNQEGSI